MCLCYPKIFFAIVGGICSRSVPAVIGSMLAEILTFKLTSFVLGSSTLWIAPNTPDKLLPLKPTLYPLPSK